MDTELCHNQERPVAVLIRTDFQCFTPLKYVTYICCPSISSYRRNWLSSLYIITQLIALQGNSLPLEVTSSTTTSRII